ncbi:MAG TPA: DNA ligase D [Solirubrobacteraceae bacterium]|jgi:bifunctional non-homologous end joining protein LigD
MARDRLAEYRAKRDFSTTREPAGGGEGPAAPAAAGRFVVQEHHATRLHWDLRLEHDGVLASWAVPNGIPEDPKRNHLAVRTEDHPLEYLDFHGEIPKGEYGAGTMTIWDRGTYEAEKWRDGEVIATFHGERMRGRYALIRTGRDDPKDWLIHRMDPPADPDAQPMPDGGIVPMLAKPGKLPRTSEGWAFEVKWDGIRAIAYSRPGTLRLETRNLRDVSAAYPELRRLNRALSSHRAILDGEIVAFDEQGRPSFARMQQRMHLTSESLIRRRAREVPVVYVIFDVLWLDGHSLMERPLRERRERLESLGLEGPNWQAPAQLDGDGEELLAATAAAGLEGLIVKRLDSCYEPGRRTGAWIKVKNVKRDEFVIVGWEPGEGRRAERIGSLLVARHDPESGELVYAGEVGTGFTDKTLDDLARRLAPLRTDHSPLSDTTRKPPRAVHWVEPLLTAEIEFTDMTNDGMLRHPSFKGLRSDKQAPVEVVGELPKDGREVVVDGREIKISNWSKVLWPKTGFTKGDLVAYYARIAPALLPHLEDRPLTLKRYPNGVEGQHFYEKNCPRHRPDWVQTADVKLSSKTITFCLAQDTATLVWLANLADIELHTSLSRVPEVGRPTMMVFDLDPGPPADIVQCCEVALVLRGLFEGVGLQSLAKTSGSKGLQVYVPLNAPDATYAQTKGFSRQVAELLEAQLPDLVVSRMTKSLRGGKILVDWSQNDEKKTTVNVYSVRARERPTVSTPVSWDEVRACLDAGDADLLSFDTEQVLGRVDELGDLFAPALRVQQRLPG